MQAPPSTTASGEQFISGFSSALPPPSGVAGAPSPYIADDIGLAHDAGNLLGAIRLYCDLLALPGVLRTEHRHYAVELQRLTARSGSLIDRLLRPGVDAAAMPVENQPAASCGARMCLADAVMACRGMIEPVVGARSLLIAVEAGARGEVAVPRETMERILLNLIKNAVEARAGGGSETAGTAGAPDVIDDGHGMVAVRVRTVQAWGPGSVGAVALSVEDRGRGMEEAAVRAALAGELDGTRPGRGLGLRVVRELVARTGGELRMRSRLGQGTTVEIVWAAVPEDGAGSG